MAKTVNRVTLLGNTGKDPEIRATGGGTMVATFSLATTERTKDAQGNWQDKPEWHNLVAYGKLAEIVRDYVKKGSKLYIEGRLTTRSWDDKDTNKKVYRTEIIVNDLSLLSGREEGNQAHPQSKPSYAQQPQSGSATESFVADEEDIPF
jgi:single-strand DNA-binding protein